MQQLRRRLVRWIRMPSKDSPASDTADWSLQETWTSKSLSETEKVGQRVDQFLGNRVDVFFRALGMVFTATRRMGSELPVTTDFDRVTLIHASRVYTNCLGTYMMLRQGMILETYSLLKSSVEGVTQGVLFFRDSASAADWLGGKRFTPDAVRRGIGGGPELAGLYRALTAVAHANPEAAQHHTVEVPGYGLMTWYGGCYRPKELTGLLAVLVDLVLVYLAEFHKRYGSQLDIGAWPLIISVYVDLNDQLRKSAEQLSNDSVELLVLGREAQPLPPVGVPLGVTAEQYDRFREQLRTLDAEELRAKARFKAVR